MGADHPNLFDDNGFDDPSLKAAVRRACGSEVAPQHLRDRIQAALASGGAVSPSPARRGTGRSRLGGRSPWSSLAAAAVLLVGLGSLGYQLLALRRDSQPVFVSEMGGSGAPVSLALPDDFAEALLTVHKTCLNRHDHQLNGVAAGNLQLIGQTMSTKLGHPVAAAAPGEGWVLRGAAICPVNGVPTAHLIFSLQNRTISVFNLPAEQLGCGTADGAPCRYDRDDQHLAGLVQGPTLICLVTTAGGDAFSEQELQQLLDRVAGRKSGSGACTGPASAESR